MKIPFRWLVQCLPLSSPMATMSAAQYWDDISQMMIGVHTVFVTSTRTQHAVYMYSTFAAVSPISCVANHSCTTWMTDRQWKDWWASKLLLNVDSAIDSKLYLCWDEYWRDNGGMVTCVSTSEEVRHPCMYVLTSFRLRRSLSSMRVHSHC